jgi:ABC-type branched-subunit amino acid transport system ATPase component
MANVLKMALQQASVALWRHGWSFRRIADELGLHRQTVSRYMRLEADTARGQVKAPPKRHKVTAGRHGADGPEPAKVTAGNPATRSRCEPLPALINGSTPPRNVRRGITFSPQGNRVFDELTVKENLQIGGYHLPRKELPPRIEEVLDFFPVLRERLRQRAGKLSGGEQQMLAVARALVPRPKLLMLDEPSLGLQPNLVNAVFEKVAQINREQGVTVLIVEQKVRQVLAISHRVYALKLGEVSFAGEPADLADNTDRLRDLFL